MKRCVETLMGYGKAIALAIAISTTSIVSAPVQVQADEIEKLKKEFSEHYQFGRFKQILMTGHKIEAVMKAKLGEGHERHIKILDRLANQYKVIGMKKKSEGLLLKAVALAEAKHGKESKSVLTTRHSLGVLYVGQNRLKEAKAQFEAAAAIAEKVFGPGDMETVVMKNNLAMLSK